MKTKSLFWSMLTAAAVLVGCTNDDLIVDDVQQSVKGKFELPALQVNMGDVQTLTEGSFSEKGGWSNFKAGVKGMENYAMRIKVQFYQEGNASNFSTEVSQYIDYSADLTDHFSFEGVSLNEGSYTAVAWADFVLKKTDGSYDVVNSSNEDLHYQTAQLSSIVDNATLLS